jgi:prepilin-type N-terminal cleavage/methylation domain-containing protein
MSGSQPLALSPQPSRAFTLIELLVVVVIILILAGVTVSMVNLTIDGDKVRSGGRQIQSYLEGARARAADARAPRGVRFLLDPTDQRTVSSIQFIAPTELWGDGDVFLTRADGNNNGDPVLNEGSGDPYFNTPPYNDSDTDVWMVMGFDGAVTADGLYPDSNLTPPFKVDSPFASGNPAQPTHWLELVKRGVLRDGNRIQIPADTGAWYTVDTRYIRQMITSNTSPSPTNPVRLLLQQKHRQQASSAANELRAISNGQFPKIMRYKLELTPAPLANQEPMQLPQNVVVHLDRCSSDPDGVIDSNGVAPGQSGYTTPSRNAGVRGNRLPASWKISYSPSYPGAGNPAGFDYTEYCDIMFSPRGAVTGPEASSGLIHLYVGERKDADRDRLDWAAAGPAAGVNWTAPEYIEGSTASDPSGNPYQRGDKSVVSIFTRTGAITVNQIFANVDGTDNVPQRFRYSETGEVAGK